MNNFNHVFARQAERIRKLRSTDPLFAEICQDYETLIGLMPLDADDPMIEDVKESLTDLEREIRCFLDPPTAGKSAPHSS